MTLYVYALTMTPPGGPSRFRLGGQFLEQVEVGRVIAIVGRVRRAPRPNLSNLRRHDAVVRTLAERFPALLPARFGACVSPEELTWILRSRQASFSRAVRHVRRRVQMTTRIFSRESGVECRVSGVESRESGAKYLEARLADARRAREVPGFEPVQQAVRRWVKDERVEKKETIATVHHLIPRASVEAYTKAVSTAASGAGLRIVLSGPLPPYAFTDPW